MKKCPMCRVDKPESDFGPDGEKTQTYCKACRRWYNRAWRQRNLEKANRPKSSWRARNRTAENRALAAARQSPEVRIKRHAQKAVHRAVKRGRLVRPDTCPRCGRDALVEAHHADYSKRLEVEWLCKRCHMAVHHPAPVQA